MNALLLSTMLAGPIPGDRIDEIKWLSAKEAFAKAADAKSARWVLVYKEWPR